MREPSQPTVKSAETGTTELFSKRAGFFGADKLIEETCLSFVAGILMMWDIEPVINERGRKEWKVPKMGYGIGIARPEGDVRVRIRSRETEMA